MCLLLLLLKGLTHGYSCCCEGNFLGRKIHVANVIVVVEKVTSEKEKKVQRQMTQMTS
jgi:hypothetical protein